MPYRFMEDIATADVAFTANGSTLEELFTASAAALLNVMLDDPALLRNSEELVLTLEQPELDLLLFAFLQEMVFLKDARQLLLIATEATVTEHDGGFGVRAIFRGEKIDRNRHHLGVDVKAVTLHRLRVAETTGGWEATVVLDI